MIYFSKTTNGFYHSEVEGDVVLPEDALEITQEDYDSLMDEQSKGKSIISDDSGKPINGVQVAQTDAQRQEGFNLSKSSLLSIASANILPLQNAVDLDEATDDEKALLVNWKKYNVALSRLTYSKDVVFPTSPE